MKRFFFLVFIVIITLSGACTQSPDDTPTDVPTANATTDTTPAATPTAEPLCDPSPSGEVFVPWDSIEGIPQVEFDLEVYSALDELCSEAAYIFVGTISDVDVEIVEEKENWNAAEPACTTKIRYHIDITQNIKGDIQANDDASVYERGYRYGDVNFYHAYFPPMCYGKTYLIFAYDTTYLCTPFVGHTEIADGTLSPSEYTELFKPEESADDKIAEIESIVADQSKPEVIISIDDGMGKLMQSISAEPDFAPVRNMTKNELNMMYHFENDALLEDYQGEELKNGDIVIWLKTVRLTEQQMQVYEASNDGATAHVIAESDAPDRHYKLSTTRHQTLITICGANEDNATIHDAFTEAIEELAE